jgi:hypothetical protein
VDFTLHEDRRAVTEPLKVAHLFLEKRFGRAATGIPYVSSKEVENAKHVLGRLPFEQVPAFLDFALAQARTTKFDVQALGGLKQYLSSYIERQAAQKPPVSARKAEDDATRDRIEYDRFRRLEADRLFATLPAAERATIEHLAHDNAPLRTKAKGPLSDIMFGIERARITIERHPGRVLSVTEWKQRRRAK